MWRILDFLLNMCINIWLSPVKLMHCHILNKKVKVKTKINIIETSCMQILPSSGADFVTCNYLFSGKFCPC